MTLTKLLIAIAISSLHTPLFAHQPVMDMAPRWNGGYGIQTRYEITEKTKQYHQSSETENPYSLFSKSSTLWIEGVYSFTREHRVSFKLPYHSKSAQQLTDGQPQQISASGLGDLILGFLNKWYMNKSGLTGNLSITPSLKIPTGALHNTLPLGTGTYDIGLSLSGSIESYLVYGLIDIFTWHHSTQTTGLKKGALYGIDMDLGLHPYHDNLHNMGIFVLLGINGRYHHQDTQNDILAANTGGLLWEAVPTLLLYRDNLMIRGQYHIPIYTRLNGVQLAPTSGFQFGIGIVY